MNGRYTEMAQKNHARSNSHFYCNAATSMPSMTLCVSFSFPLPQRGGISATRHIVSLMLPFIRNAETHTPYDLLQFVAAWRQFFQ
jgi:hypothetical protein